MRRSLRLSIIVIYFLVLDTGFGQNAVDFTLKDLEGNLVRLSDFRGKNVVLVNFWATWCVPCVKEFPHFQRFHETYKEKGLVILAISVDGPESVAMVKPFMKRYEYAFPVLLDTNSEVIALYNPRVVLPYTVLVDRDGNIRHVHQGYSPGDERLMEEEIIGLLAPKPGAEVRKYSIHLNEAFLYRNFSDEEYVNDIRLGRSSQVINQLDLSLAWKSLLVGLRGDAYLDFSPLESNLSLAKRVLEFNQKRYSLRLGDFYQTTGRGLIFSLLKTFEKEGLEYIIDTTVDGGKFFWSHNSVSAEIYGGWIERERSEVKDKMFGATLGWRHKAFADFRLNLFGSRLEPGLVLDNKDIFMESMSVDIPNIAEKAKFYGEFCLVQKKRHSSEERVTGHGVYLESGWFLGRLTLLLEFKDYSHLDYEYNRPPMLESELVPILANQFASESRDATGIAAKMDYSFPDQDLLIFGRFAQILDNSRNRPRPIFDIFAGAEKKFKVTGWLNVLGGYRAEEAESLIFYYTSGRTLYFQANLSYPLTQRFSLEADFKGKSFDGRYFDYYERRSFLSFLYSPHWVLTIFFDQTDDPEILFFKDKRDWWGFQLEHKFKQASFIRVFCGSNKGGIKCSGGVCKFFPPFEGLRVDAMFRF